MTSLLACLATTALAGGATEVARVDGANLQRPAWSADGKQLSWEANNHDRQEVQLHVGPSAGPFRRVLPGSARSNVTAGFSTVRATGAVAHELSFSPPAIGGYVFSAANDLADYDLYVAGGTVLAASPGADGGASWSPDGRWIAFTSARSGEGDLYVVDVQKVELPPRRLTSTTSSSELYAAWSPDATRIAYVGHSESGDNLWVAPVNGGAPIQLTSWSGNQVRPSWSPDGKLVAFYANHEDPARFDLYVVEPRAGAVPRKLADRVVLDAAGPSWMPSAASLVVALDDDDAYDPLAVVPVAGGAAKRLDLGTVGHGDLDVVARDGQVWIAYVAQGKAADAERAFRRLFVAPITP